MFRNTIWIFALCLSAQEQATPPKETAVLEIKSLAPRSKATDYQAHANLGKVQIGAEFMRHAVPTSDGTFSTEDYVVVEVGFYGEKTKISSEDFTLSINGKKPQPIQPFGLIMSNLKDPEWIPPEAPPAKKSALNAGGDGGGGAGDPPPLPPKMPMALVHIMDQKVQKAVLPEGERTLPAAGVLFFTYRGRADKIKSVALNYTGPAGKTTLELQP